MDKIKKANDTVYEILIHSDIKEAIKAAMTESYFKGKQDGLDEAKKLYEETYNG